ncbi:phosphoglycerate kinase [Nonomuraea insulae]|uniref:Phosphoglycerate kinase n=1 Tax=Nonomuraea insulae TaxID=1616787 RepID=A0ABW1CTG7_9ACTN
MPSDSLRGVPLLRERRLRRGERWIYSAGFNVGRDLPDTSRIDAELADLDLLAAAGCRVALLSHQGRHGDGSAEALDFAARYLGARLGRPVRYVPGNASAGAARQARALRDGEIAVFGNTRAHAGEERNDPALARRFARLGELVAVGGFSKAHRAHASNAGLLDRLPAFAAGSLVSEPTLLAPWAGIVPHRLSVAVVGGVKPEKTLIGLEALTRTYDLVIPGGVVLNTVLRVLGHDIGRSALGDRPEQCAQVARTVLGRANRAELYVPSEVIVAPAEGPTNGPAKGSAMGPAEEPAVGPAEGSAEGPALSARGRMPVLGARGRIVPIAEGVPAGHMIVDFVLELGVRARLDALAAAGGRALLAGTPCRYTDGFRDTADALLAAFGAPGVDALLLGGDTTAELPWQGPRSTGGGSALHYLAHGTCPVLDSLRRSTPR